MQFVLEKKWKWPLRTRYSYFFRGARYRITTLHINYNYINHRGIRTPYANICVCMCVCVLFLFVRKGSFLFHSIWLYSRWLLNRWAPAIWNLRGQTSHDRRAVRVTSYLTLWSVHQRSPYNRSCKILYYSVWRHLDHLIYIFKYIFHFFLFVFHLFYNINFYRDTS